MAKEIGNLYYTIGIKGEKDATASLKRVQDAVSRTKESGAAHGSDLKGAFGSMASAMREGLIDSIWKNISAGKNASVIGGIGGIFEQAVSKGVKAGLIKTRDDVAALYGVTSGKEAAAALNALAKSKSATVQQQKKQVIGSRETQESAIDLQKQKSELQSRRNQLRSEAQAIESRRGGTAALRQKEAAPLHAESMRLAGIIKEIDKKLSDPTSNAAEDRLLRRQQEARERLNSKRYSGNRNAVGEQGPQPAGLGRANWGEEELVAFEKQFNKLSRKTKTAVARFKTEVVAGVTDLPLNRWLKTQEENDAIDEREQLRKERLASRRAQRGALSNRLQQGMGLPVGSIGGSQSVFGVGAKPQLQPYTPAVPPQMHGPDLPAPLPTPWLYRVNDIMSLRGHRNLSGRAANASALSDEITSQVLGYGINNDLVDARNEVRAAQREQRIASRAGNQEAMDAANRRLNTAQNNLLDTEERRLFVAGQHRDIIRDVNTFLGTTVSLESKIAAAEQAAVNYARQRNQDMTPDQEEAVRQRVREGLVSRSAHGGTKAADYENKLADIRSRRSEQSQYYRSTVTRNPDGSRTYGDAVAREYRNNLVKAERIARRQVEREQRLSEIRNEHGGEAPRIGQRGYIEYNRLSRLQRRDDRSMMKYNDMLNNTSYTNNRWNTQIMELGYGIQDFTQVLAGGGGLSAALRGASNNFSQFFAVSGGKNAALWATGIGVGALAVGAALDAISKQSKEAAENLAELRKVADDLSSINLGTLSDIRSSPINALNPDIFGSQEGGVGKIESARETAKTARLEMDFYRRTRSSLTDVGEMLSDMGTAFSVQASRFSRGDEYVGREARKGKFAFTDDMREAEQLFIARLNGEHVAEGRSKVAKAVTEGGLLTGAQALINSNSTLGEPLYQAAKNIVEGESQKRISDYFFGSNIKNYKSQSGMLEGLSARSQYAAIPGMFSKKNELEQRNSLLRSEIKNQELTPEAKAAYKQEISRNEARLEVMDDRIARYQARGIGVLGSVNGHGESGMSMESALDEYVQAIAENKLSKVPGRGQAEAASLEAKLRQTASSYSASQMTGESISAFQDRVATEIKHQQEIIAQASKESGKNLDYLSDRIKMLGDLAVDVAKAMETYDRSIAGTAGLLERDAEYERDMAAIEQEKQNRYAENKKKYELTDPVLQMELDAAAHDDANRKIKRREFQMIKDQNDDKMFFGSKIASMMGGREGRKLQAEMEYDQMLASIEQSKMDPAMKAEKQQEAKDIRSAMMEQIDRKNVSFTDVGSQWKTIQSSLQGDPNKKILNHWNKYMNLVTGEGIRVKLNVGT